MIILHRRASSHARETDTEGAWATPHALAQNPAPVVHVSREAFALFLGGLRSTQP
ncbi:hypothetical protein [Streptomyces tubercidicus]|uniref:hypothetical protein n=1 Tax=Streptomyces tubercidicus TaxID=47759 RepID=UPI003466FABB